MHKKIGTTTVLLPVVSDRLLKRDACGFGAYNNLYRCGPDSNMS